MIIIAYLVYAASLFGAATVLSATVIVFLRKLRGARIRSVWTSRRGVISPLAVLALLIFCSLNYLVNHVGWPNGIILWACLAAGVVTGLFAGGGAE